MNYSSKEIKDFVEKVEKMAKEISLLKFKIKRVADVLNPDDTDARLIKWLKARNFDEKAAEKIYRENYHNRIVTGINTIMDTYKKPEVIEKYDAVGVLGFAKDGSLIRYTAAGRLDFYGFIMSMSCYDLCHYFSYIMECDLKQLKEEYLRTGTRVDEITYIIDMEGFHIQQVLHRNVIEMGLDFTRLLQDCYPEIWSHVLVVNAPTIFGKAFNIFKPVLRSNVLERMSVVNKDSSRELLLKYIHEDVLPVFLGGKRVDSNGDPKCTEFLTFGGKVPESMYSRNRMTPLQPTDPRVRAYNIRARSAMNYSMSVKEATYFRVEMTSENGSLAMSIFYRGFTEADEDDPEFPGENEYLDDNDENCKYKMISIAIRAQTHCTPLDGLFFLQRPGVYVLKISNITSWFTSRKVLLRTELIPPNSEALT